MLYLPWDLQITGDKVYSAYQLPARCDPPTCHPFLNNTGNWPVVRLTSWFVTHNASRLSLTSHIQCSKLSTNEEPGLLHRHTLQLKSSSPHGDSTAVKADCHLRSVKSFRQHRYTMPLQFNFQAARQGQVLSQVSVRVEDLCSACSCAFRLIY
jgi:hypothetical protein